METLDLGVYVEQVCKDLDEAVSQLEINVDAERGLLLLPIAQSRRPSSLPSWSPMPENMLTEVHLNIGRITYFWLREFRDFSQRQRLSWLGIQRPQLADLARADQAREPVCRKFMRNNGVNNFFRIWITKMPSTRRAPRVLGIFFPCRSLRHTNSDGQGLVVGSGHP